MAKTIIATPNAPAAIGTYSQAVRVGGTVYMSGQIGLDPATMQMVDGIDAQIVRVFENLKAVAEAAAHEVSAARALVAPAFLEGTDTLSAMRGLCDDVRMMRRIGRVKTYRARTGEAVNGEKDQKLVDHLTERGYDCVRVGGPRPERPEETQAWTRLALAELFGQAANVVAIKPGHVLAYAGNEATLRALRAGGVTVRTIEGTSLARLHGGPHCLTLPLERDA